MTDPITTLTGIVIVGIAIAAATFAIAVAWYGAVEVFGALARDYEEWIGRD